MFHAKGTAFMAKEFPAIEAWLLKNGWYICELTNKWKHD